MLLRCFSRFVPNPVPVVSNWRGTRSAVKTELLCQHIEKLLGDRLDGDADTTEPLGFLTHHLVHDPAIWDVTRAFWDVVLKHPVAIWKATDKGDMQ